MQQGPVKKKKLKLGYVNPHAVVNTSKLLADRDFNDEKDNEFFCEICVIFQQTRKKHPIVVASNKFKHGKR